MTLSSSRGKAAMLLRRRAGGSSFMRRHVETSSRREDCGIDELFSSAKRPDDRGTTGAYYPEPVELPPPSGKGEVKKGSGFPLIMTTSKETIIKA